MIHHNLSKRAKKYLHIYCKVRNNRWCPLLPHFYSTFGKGARKQEREIKYIKNVEENKYLHDTLGYDKWPVCRKSQEIYIDTELICVPSYLTTRCFNLLHVQISFPHLHPLHDAPKFLFNLIYASAFSSPWARKTRASSAFQKHWFQPPGLNQRSVLCHQ